MPPCGVCIEAGEKCLVRAGESTCALCSRRHQSCDLRISLSDAKSIQSKYVKTSDALQRARKRIEKARESVKEAKKAETVARAERARAKVEFAKLEGELERLRKSAGDKLDREDLLEREEWLAAMSGGEVVESSSGLQVDFTQNPYPELGGGPMTWWGGEWATEPTDIPDEGPGNQNG